MKLDVPAHRKVLVAVAMSLALVSCDRSPTTPTPVPPGPAPVTIASVTPSAPMRSGIAQDLMIRGIGFRPGLTLRISDPQSVTVTVPKTAILDLLPASFRVALVLSQAGQYRLVVQQLDGESSAPFLLDVARPAGPTPQVDAVSPSSTIVDAMPQQVSLIGLNFDASLAVRIVDPDGAITEKRSPDVTTNGDSVIQFLLVFSKIGTYTFSVWTVGGIGSNVADVRVR